MERQVYLEHQRGSTPCLLVSTCPGAEEDTIPVEGGEDHVKSGGGLTGWVSYPGITTCHLWTQLSGLGHFKDEVNSLKLLPPNYMVLLYAVTKNTS